MTTTPSARTGRRDGDRDETRAVIPVPRPAAEAVPVLAPSNEDWVTYPGVRYALERLAAGRRPAADHEPDRLHHS